MLAFSAIANAEFNIENNVNQPTHIKLGYRNVLNSGFIYTDNDKNFQIKKNTVNIPYEDILISLKPLLRNDNRIKGNDYFFLNYEPFIQLGGREYKFPFIVSDVSAIGSSVLFNDSNIVIFSIESYVNRGGPTCLNN